MGQAKRRGTFEERQTAALELASQGKQRCTEREKRLLFRSCEDYGQPVKHLMVPLRTSARAARIHFDPEAVSDKLRCETCYRKAFPNSKLFAQ